MTKWVVKNFGNGTVNIGKYVSWDGNYVDSLEMAELFDTKKEAVVECTERGEKPVKVEIMIQEA